MSGRKLQWLIALVLLTHAIGHIMGILPAFGLSPSPTWTSHSWLLSGLLGQSVANGVSTVIWLAATIGEGAMVWNLSEPMAIQLVVGDKATATTISAVNRLDLLIDNKKGVPESRARLLYRPKLCSV